MLSAIFSQLDSVPSSTNAASTSLHRKIEKLFFNFYISEVLAHLQTPFGLPRHVQIHLAQFGPDVVEEVAGDPHFRN